MSSRAERRGLPLWPVAHLAQGRGPGGYGKSLGLCSGPFLSFFLPFVVFFPRFLPLSPTPTPRFRERYRFHANHSVDRPAAEGRSNGDGDTGVGGLSGSSPQLPFLLHESTADSPLLLLSPIESSLAFGWHDQATPRGDSTRRRNSRVRVHFAPRGLMQPGDDRPMDNSS